MTVTVENYFSPENSWKYMGSTQYKNFNGTLGQRGCQAAAMAELRGECVRETTTALLVGKYVDAHFEGSLTAFKDEHPEIFNSRTGDLKVDYQKAQQLIDRAERDPLFREFMAGEKQVIMTANFFGTDWKCKIDSYHPGRVIADLKCMRELRKSFWAKDFGRMSFVEYWGYDYQAAIYQEIVFLNTGDRLDFVIPAISKEDEPDIELIGFRQSDLDARMIEIKNNMPRTLAVKKGEVEPERCGSCNYCRSTKKLNSVLHYKSLIDSDFEVRD